MNIKKPLLLSVCRFAVDSTKSSGDYNAAKNMQKVVTSKFMSRRSVVGNDKNLVKYSTQKRTFCMFLSFFVLFFMLFLGFAYIVVKKVHQNQQKIIENTYDHNISYIINMLIDPLTDGQMFLNTIKAYISGNSQYSNVTEMYELLQSAADASKGNVVYFEIVTEQNDALIIENGNNGSTFYFINGAGSDYFASLWNPYSLRNGDEDKDFPVRPFYFNASDDDFYKDVISGNGTIVYDDPSFGSFSDRQRATIMIGVSIDDIFGEGVKGAIFACVDISSPQQYISSKDLKNSRCAICTDRGNIIVIDNSSRFVEEYSRILITKKIDEVDDNVWGEMIKIPEFSERKNFTTTVTLHGKKKHYIVAIIPIFISSDIYWYLYSVECLTDDLTDYYDDYVTASNWFANMLIIAIVILVICSLISRNCFVTRKNAAIVNNVDEYHIHKDTVGASIKGMRSLIKRCENREIIREISQIIAEIEHAKESWVLNIKAVKSVEDKTTYSFLSAVFSSKRVIGTAELFGSNQYYSSVYESRSRKEDCVIEPRKLIKQLNRSDTLEAFEMLFERCYGPFNKTKLKNYINETIIELSVDAGNEIQYLTDSICFISAIIENKIRFTPDVLAGIIISSITFHKMMVNRKEKKDITARFFVRDRDEAIRETIKELGRAFLLLENENDRTWDSIAQTAVLLAGVMPVNTHYYVFENIPLYKLDLQEAEKQQSVITLELAKIITISSMTSFFFHSPAQTKETLIELTGSQTSDFAACITKEYVAETKASLSEIFGYNFVKRLSGQ